MAPSTCTKHFVTGFTETLRAELEGTGVVVYQALPGPVESGFDEAANIGPPGALDRIFRISAARCAREVIRGFERGAAHDLPWLCIQGGDEASRGIASRPAATSRALPRRLQSHGAADSRLFFFAPASAEVVSSSIQSVSIEEVFQTLQEHGSAAHREMIKRMLSW